MLCVHSQLKATCLFCRALGHVAKAQPTRPDLQLAFEKFAVATIYEVMRWETTVTTNSSPFRLSNNHRAFYARKWMQEHPQYPEFFTTKEQDHA